MPADLDEIAENLAPRTGNNYAAKIDELPNGKYHFKIIRAEFKDINQKSLFAFTVQVIDGGHDGKKFDVAYWLHTNDRDSGAIKPDAVKLGILLDFLKRLGFDADNWKASKGRPVSKSLPQAVALLPGIEFHGAKASKASGGKEYHSLYANTRSDEDGKPATFGKAEMAAAGAEAAALGGAPADNSPIEFN
jgi:hypothetical protein